MTFEMTAQEASHLAAFLEKLRKRIPGDPWQKPGIENALGTARHRANAPDLAIAAIRAAEIPTNRTPAVIGMDGPHWRETTKPPRPLPVEPNNRCTVCSEHRDRCRELWTGDHDFTPPIEKLAPDVIHGAVEALREDLPTTRPPTPRPTLDDLAASDPAMHERVEAIRKALPGPSLREPEGELA